MQIVVAADALEYVTSVLEKISEVAKNNNSARLSDCLSHVYGSDSCNGLRFIGDIVKARHSDSLITLTILGFVIQLTETPGEWSGIVSASGS
jgi:hypothetical protein